MVLGTNNLIIWHQAFQSNINNFQISLSKKKLSSKTATWHCIFPEDENPAEERKCILQSNPSQKIN